MGSRTVDSSTELHRGLGVWQATALNVANMVGIGPFITIPAFLAAMGGPQAMVGWVIAAILVLCDGLVWSELGAALPGSGGSYHFLSEIFGRMRFGQVGSLQAHDGFLFGEHELVLGFKRSGDGIPIHLVPP